MPDACSCLVVMGTHAGKPIAALKLVDASRGSTLPARQACCSSSRLVSRMEQIDLCPRATEYDDGATVYKEMSIFSG